MTMRKMLSSYLKNLSKKARVVFGDPPAASLLGISSGDLGLCFTTRNVVTCGETFVRRQTALEARTTRDSLARGLYNRLFRWIVNQINALLGISRIA
jgi:myosin heavy subunit